MIVIYLLGTVLFSMLFVPIGVYLLGLSGMYLLAGANFFAYFLLCAILLFLSRDVYKEDFKKIESWPKFIGQMGIGLLLTFSSIFIGNLIVMFIGGTQVEVAENQEMIEALLNTTPILIMITAIIFGPIVEEIIFRLVLINLFNWKPIYGVIFSSVIFGLFHVLVGGWIHIITYSLAGLVFGYFYLKNDKNIWHVTVLHILHNGLTIGLVFLLQHLVALYGLA